MDYFCPLCKKTFFRDGRQNNKPFITPSGKYKSYCDYVGRMSYCKLVKKTGRGLGLKTGSFTWYLFKDGKEAIVYDRDDTNASHG